MRLNQFKQMAVFAKVVEKESFTAAAEALDMTKSMVSQHVSHLEKELGVRLLNRTTRRLTLTEEGAVYHEGCVRMTQEAEMATNRVSSFQIQPSGVLRITAPVGAVPSLVPMVSKFMEANPLIKIDLLLEDVKLNLVEHQIDVAIQYGWLQDSSMFATSLGKFSLVVCASPAYLEKHSVPQTPGDLVHHYWISYNRLPNPRRWTFSHNSGQQETVDVQEVVNTNSTEALKLFVAEGRGIGVFPNLDAQRQIEEGKFVEVLSDYHLPDGGIYAIFPSKEQLSVKVRAFIDFLKTEEFSNK